MSTKQQRIDHVRTLCDNVIPYFESTFFNRYIEDYKNYLGYTGDRGSVIEDWQTNIFFPMIPAIVDTMYASIYDSKIKFNVNGEGVEGTDNLLNNAFDHKGEGKENLMDAVKETIITGKGFIKPVFVKYTDSKVINGIDYGHQIKRPMLDYVSVFDIFYDYNGTLEESAYTVERHIYNRKSILKRYGARISKGQKDGFKVGAYIDRVLKDENISRFSSYDVNRVRHIIAYNNMIEKNNLSTVIPTASSSNADTNAEDTIEGRNNLYAIDFNKNKVYEVIEYMDDDGSVVIVDGKFLFEDKRSTTTNSSKVASMSFNKIPGTSDATGISTNLGQLQGITNTLYNIFLDNLKMQIAPMFEKVGGLNQMLGKKDKITYSPYKVVPTNTPGSLRKIELGIGGFEPINVIQFIEAFAEKRSGVNEYIMGGQGKVERIAGGVDLIFNQYKSKLMPLTNSINNAMGYVARQFLMMYAINYTEQELQELGLQGELDLKRFLDERNITFNLSSLALLADEEAVKDVTENIQSIAPFLQGPNGPNINTEELIRGIFKRDIDVDELLRKEQPQQQGGGLEDLINNFNVNG